MRVIRLGFLGLAAVLGHGCGGGRTQVEIGPPPQARTIATLSGPLCQDSACKCAQGPDDAGVPDAGRKRYEVRLKSAQQLWATLPGDQILYKNSERAEECFYVDLAPGKHEITLRASNKDGVSAEMIVRELGEKTKSWYDTFRFECGNPGACSFQELDDMRADYAALEKNLMDHCGSTKVKGISWDHGRAPDGFHPDELLVRATLDIYKFEPSKKSGDPTCGAGDGHDRSDDVPPPADGTPDEAAPAP